MRTQEEIVAKIEEVKKTDFFGAKTGDLIGFLDFEHAKPYLKPDTTPDQWEQSPLTREAVLKEMEDYMEFAWDKANGFRGLSASRSMDHYSTWIWLLGDEDKLGDLSDYQYYGKDNLVKICEHYGWDSSKWDDGVRANSEE